MRFAQDIDSDVKDSLSFSHVLGIESNAVKSGFGDSIVEQLLVTHASVQNNSEDPTKKEGRVVCELVVTEEMLNGGGNIHGGCSALLIDMCSSLCLMVYQRGMHVSQSLNIVYHSPATLGETLRIVNTTITVGARAMSARTEIWSATKHRLVASGVHIKMRPSKPKL
ncbi:HotDog domain-containing protein [Mycena olivaceomarginata]|nr:HotDog domain-containing protein [Mycena olivaceomarginata]